MLDNIIEFIKIAWGWVGLQSNSQVAVLALLVSLASLVLSSRTNRKTLEIASNDLTLKEKRLKLEIDNKLHEAFYLMGADLKTEIIYDFSNLEALHKAKQLIEDCITLDPKRYKAYVMRGDIRAVFKKTKLAEDDYKLAIALNPDLSGAYNSLSLLMNEVDRLHEAEDNIRKAIKISPDEPIYHYNLGNILAKSGDIEGAEKSYIKATTLDPFPTPYYLNLGITLFRKGQSEKALEMLNQAENFNTKKSRFYLGKGTVLADLGKEDEAYEAFIKASELEPNEYMTHYVFGDYLSSRKKFKEAIVHLDKAVRINPELTISRVKLAIAQFANNQDSEALSNMMIVIKKEPERSDYKRLVEKMQDFC